MKHFSRGLLAVLATVVLPLATGASAQVGGSLSGLEPNAVICRNVTTGQTVSMVTSEASWDCQAMGLVVNPGDTVITGGRGVAPAETCSHPVEQSGIGGPGGTGWPYELGNSITMNVAGRITKLGVDRWDKAGLTWTVDLWDGNCSPLRSVSFEGGTGWVFGDVEPVAVAPGDRFYVSYVVSQIQGSYLYRDTPSPVDVGAYTIEFASYNNPALCPDMTNGPIVSPVDIEVCVPGAGPKGEPACHRGGLTGGVRVATDEYLSESR